ncbi:MAG TPA: fimbrial assembly protein [Thermoanaerobacterales bacterium]|uniref:PilN domain-containing protein n=1 Tax=Tepidanaerobacter sp. GT38 TaxID=2722793 RepID=UPI001819A660|nr:fimbrial assembly protein [Tepidanaerobacter sp. GT38]MCG1013005.1 fimbrial assembly protein [Tepidanaerobacter sp. GT38]HHY42014.1 fimbrial assembly protein [Thermoanaerobacterales bacterium]
MHKLNLLPKEILVVQNKKRLSLFCILAGGILLVLLIVIIITTSNSILFLEDEILKAHQDIAKIKSKIQINSDIQKILNDFEKRQKIYNDVFKNKTNYSTTINCIVDLVPNEVSIIYIGIEESGRIKISGYTPRHVYVSRLMEDLKTIDGVLDVLLGFTRFTEFRYDVKHNYAFEIIVELSKERLQ